MSATDWVIVGSPVLGGGVRVTASVEVAEGSVGPVSRVAEGVFTGAPEGRRDSYTPDGYRIEVRAKSVVMVEGSTYPDALRLLSALWQPPEPGPVQQAIEGG